MEIRTARPDDLETVTEIYNREVESGTSTFDTEPRTGRAAVEWFEEHASDGFPLMVAEEDGAVVGWASLSPWSDRGAYAGTVEGSLFVGERHRGRGIGALLNGALIERATRAGHRSLIARIERGNEASRRLLLTSGFRSVGVMHRAGVKFARVLDVEIFELMLDGD